jgi:hypothetical protein
LPITEKPALAKVTGGRGQESGPPDASSEFFTVNIRNQKQYASCLRFSALV